MIQLAAVSVSSDVVPFPRVRSHCENSPTKTDSTGWAPLTRPTGQWQPTCDHDTPVIPATVLDPFVGSGTTCAVAQKLGRRSVGLDASPALSLEHLVEPMLDAPGFTAEHRSVEPHRPNVYHLHRLRGMARGHIDRRADPAPGPKKESVAPNCRITRNTPQGS